MLETLRSDSRAYWIGRVNDCDHLSLKLAYQQNASSNPMPLSRYGMSFDVSNIHARSKQASAYNNNPVFQIPGKLGDVIMQGRNGSYLRHTYNPQSGRTGKPGLLEMGILANKVYEPNNLSSTVGDTKTKTVHFSDTLLSTLGAPFIKKTPNTNDFIETPLQDIPDIQNQGSDVLRETKRNFIVNMANEIYNVSNTIDSERSMYRQVLGEKLNEHLKKQGVNVWSPLSMWICGVCVCVYRTVPWVFWVDNLNVSSLYIVWSLVSTFTPVIYYRKADVS